MVAERQRLGGSEALLSLTSGVPVPGEGWGREMEGGQRKGQADLLRQALKCLGAQGKTPGWTDAQCFQWALQGDSLSTQQPDGLEGTPPDQAAFLLPPGSGLPVDSG